MTIPPVVRRLSTLRDNPHTSILSNPCPLKPIKGVFFTRGSLGSRLGPAEKISQMIGPHRATLSLSRQVRDSCETGVEQEN